MEKVYRVGTIIKENESHPISIDRVYRADAIVADSSDIAITDIYAMQDTIVFPLAGKECMGLITKISFNLVQTYQYDTITIPDVNTLTNNLNTTKQILVAGGLLADTIWNFIIYSGIIVEVNLQQQYISLFTPYSCFDQGIKHFFPTGIRLELTNTTIQYESAGAPSILKINDDHYLVYNDTTEGLDVKNNHTLICPSFRVE